MRIAVLGGGNGSMAAAGDLALQGHEVRLWRRDAEAVAAHIAAGSRVAIRDFAGQHEAQLALVTTEIDAAVAEAELILCPAPAFAQESIAAALAPHLVDGQVVFLPPATFGSLIFAGALRDAGNPAKVAFAETGTLPWLTRKHGPFSVQISGRAKRLPVGVFPLILADHALAVIERAFPGVIEPCGDALSGALMNAGGILHPPLIVMNAGPIEHFDSWDIHKEGTQPAIRRVTDALDAERVAVREALGYGAPHFPIADHYAREGDEWMYGRGSHDKLTESGDWREHLVLREHRYMREDLRLGLSLLVSVAELAGVATPLARSLLAIGGAVCGEDFSATGRTLASLGLVDLDREDLQTLLRDGFGEGEEARPDSLSRSGEGWGEGRTSPESTPPSPCPSPTWERGPASDPVALEQVSSHHQIACLAAGRMGRGIAIAYAYAGHDVALIDLKPREPAAFAALEAAALGEVNTTLASLAELGLFPPAAVPEIAARVSVVPFGQDEVALSGAAIVFEGVPEIVALKREVLARASALMAPDSILASTTSTILVDDLSDAVVRPERFLNAHWLNPAFIVPLVELSPGRLTDPAATASLKGSLEAIGKVPVVCAASPGYIVPRIQVLAMNEAARMVDEGVASPEDLDRAIRFGFGFRFAVLGLTEFIDWGGGDILFYAGHYLTEALGHERYASPPVIARNMEAGHVGLRTGRGFLDYAGLDIAAYQHARLGEFVALLRHLGLARPPVLAGPKPGRDS